MARLHANCLNLAGQRFGRLTAVAYLGQSKWSCKCDCGAETRTLANNLIRNKAQSCGCLKRETAAAMMRTHGMRNAPEYRVWSTMIERCHNPNNGKYKSYGARGIRVCERWRTDFAAFIADMGQRPTPQHSLDRRDNDGNYEPGNVHWATREQQANNTRANVVLSWRGEHLTMAQWSRRIGISQYAIRQRLERGWAVEDALTISSRSVRKWRRRPVVDDAVAAR